MAISLKHSFTSAVADEGDTSLVRPSNWNAEHTLTLATSRLLGRTTAGTGAVEEISVGTGLNLSSGSLSVSSTTPQVNSINTFTVAQVIETTDNSNPALRITQLGTADALRVEDETSPDATPFVITAAGHAIAGYGSTLTIETVVPQFQSHTATLDEGGFGGVDWGNTATGQVNWFGKSRGGSYGTQGIVQSGDVIGDFRFYGSDGVGLIPAAKIEVEVDGTPGVNDMPGRISFFTTADGASTVTERFRIGNAGQWGIGGATYGTSTQYFKSGGASAAPSWATISNTDISGLGTMSTQNANSVSITGGSITGITDLVVADGGTGVSSLTAYAVLAGGTTSTGAVQTVSGLGTSGQVLTSNGAGALPTWQDSAGGIWTHIGTSTASASSAIVFTNLGSYEMLRLSYFNVRPTTDDSTLRITLSSNNGSTYIITGYDGLAQQGNARFLLTNSAATQGNLNADGVAAGTVILGNFNIATKTTLTVSAVYGTTAGAISNWESYAWQSSLTAMNAIRIFYSASGVEGTIATGTFVLEGLIQ